MSSGAIIVMVAFFSIGIAMWYAAYEAWKEGNFPDVIVTSLISGIFLTLANGLHLFA